MSTRVGLLWHLHQPDYRHPASGRPTMPWARLHALRGYRDLLIEVVEHEAAMTINVVPSLWDQLLYYAEGGDDRHLELTRMPARSLTDALADELVSTLPGGHHTMTDSRPAYAALRRRLSRGAPYVESDLRDLQVWATLAWFGATAHRDFEVLGSLVDQGAGFSEGDKESLLAVQGDVLGEIPHLLRRLAEARGPALSTSPYFHPILPLLVNAAHARRCMPELPDEVRFAWPEDALRQLVDGRERIRELCGEAPRGLWPSEGSVSPEVVALAAEAGFRWLTTDVGVLRRSEASTSARPGAWDLGLGMVGFFRDTDLSDRIGFRYAQRDAREAVDDFVAAARAAGPGMLTVALDGENPWESYPDAGGAFRRRLYDALRSGPVRGVTLDDAAEEAPVGTVTRIFTGSWIGADFRIWIGDPADRDAWRALGETREAVERASPARKAAAMPHVLAAEGSDWTWWYGDEFHTEWDGAFDQLFREHLRAAWQALDASPPAWLDRPIGGAGAPTRREPFGWLDVDWSSAGGWVPWQTAGRLRAWNGSMAAGSAVLEVRFGWVRSGELWIRLVIRGRPWAVRAPTEGVESRLVGGAQVIRIAQPGPVALQLVGPAGEIWPPEPVVLEPPARPELAWWEL